MFHRPRIKNLAVIAPVQKKKGGLIRILPRGEAPLPGHVATEMVPSERIDMVGRLTNSIKKLMDVASADHDLNETKTDPDYITRLTTNEHFFYTREPLKLKEFQSLQEQVLEYARTKSPGVQLVLGSFAVSTYDSGGSVMNVTTHITCGENPTVTFIVKRYKAFSDPAYQYLSGQYQGAEVGNSDMNLTSEINLPSITLQGIQHKFTYDNIVECKTPRGTPFLTAVEICAEHTWKTAQKSLREHLSKFKKHISYPVSHVIPANSIDLQKKNCIGPESDVLHVDPYQSPKKYKKNVRKQAKTLMLEFGEKNFMMYALEPQEVSQVKHTYAYQRKNHTRTTSEFFKDISSATGQKPTYMADSEEIFNENYQHLKGDALKTQILENLKNKIHSLESIEEFQVFKVKLINSYEYYILKTGQDGFTRKMGKKTTSLKALETMLNQKETFLAEYAPKHKIGS